MLIEEDAGFYFNAKNKIDDEGEDKSVEEQKRFNEDKNTRLV